MGGTIWTIGHSTRTAEEFIRILGSFQIAALVDVRRFPGSRRYPHFNVNELSSLLGQHSILYRPVEALGGRRKPNPDSKNSVWRNEAFRGYADYAETDDFKAGLNELTEIARQRPTAYMCSEAVWWRCHRAIISDVLKEAGWTVMHIMSEDIAKEHPFTAAYLSTHSIKGGTQQQLF